MSPGAGNELDEVRRRGTVLLRSVVKQLTALAAREYPTESPKRFVEYLKRLVAGLQRVLDTDDDPDTAKLISQFARELGGHVRFLESASYPRIPWALIAPMEKLIKAIVEGAEIVLRSQWSYNYKIRQMSEGYKAALEALPREYLSDSVFAPDAPAWNVVSLPRIDADNVLMHVILGHEVGHRIAERFLDREDSNAVQQEISALVGDATWAEPMISTLAAQYPMRAIAVKNRVFQLVDKMRAGGLQELISDVVGVQLFGPSFLFALHESSLDGALDGLPIPESYHPPWRYRYRKALAEFRRQGYEARIASIGGSAIADGVRAALEGRVKEIDFLTRHQSDIRALQADDYTSRAYALVDRVLGPVPEFVETELRGLAFEKEDFKQKLEPLLGLLALGIPPMRREEPRPDFRYAILAGWGCKIARVSFDARGEWSIEDDATIQRLVHKALEYANLAEEYELWRQADEQGRDAR